MVQVVAIEISFAAVRYDTLSADASLMGAVVDALKAWTATRTQVAAAYITVTLSASARRLQEEVGIFGARRAQSASGTTADITIQPDASTGVTQIQDRLAASDASVSVAMQAVEGIDAAVEGGDSAVIAAVVGAPQVIWAAAVSTTPVPNADAAWGVMTEISFLAVLYDSLSVSSTLMSSFTGAVQAATAVSVGVPETHVTVTLSAVVRQDGNFGTMATLVIQHDHDTTTTEIMSVLTSPQFAGSISAAVQQVGEIRSVAVGGDVGGVIATMRDVIIILNDPPTTTSPSTTAGGEALTDIDAAWELSPGFAVRILTMYIVALQYY